LQRQRYLGAAIVEAREEATAKSRRKLETILFLGEWSSRCATRPHAAKGGSA
jgi:hypothetical protein